MRRKDREITEQSQICEILNKCKVCHVSMVDNGKPYAVALNFGYEYVDGRFSFYFHCAHEGRKLDILRNNRSVCLTFDHVGELIYSGKPCNCGYRYESVHVFGEAEFIENVDEKCKALTSLMEQQIEQKLTFTEKEAQTVCVFKVNASECFGKVKG